MLALRRSILPAARDKRSFGISDLAPIGGYRTEALGGEPGVGTGFGTVILISPRKYAPLGFRFAGRSNNVNAGWLHMGSPSGYGGFYGSMFNASGGYIYENVFNLVPSDIGKLFFHVQYFDATGFLRTYLGRFGGYYGPEIVTAAGAAQPLASYGPYSDASVGMTYFGGVQYADGQNIRDYFSLLALMTFQSATAPTVAQLADLADRTRQLGDIPQKWSGPTVTHRWSVRDNYVRNRAVINRSTSLVKNFISDANSYQAATGLRGGAVWWMAFAFVPFSLTGTKRYYYNISGSTQGTFSGISIFQNGSVVHIEIIDNAGNYGGAQISQQLFVGDLFQPQLLIVDYNGVSVRCYFRRNLGVGSVVARTFTPAVAAARVGRAYSSATEPLPTFGWLGMMGSDAHSLTVAEAFQIYDSFRANGRLTALAGKTQKLWDVPQDILDAGGASPTTVIERMGTNDPFTPLNGAGSMLVDTVVENGIVAPYVLPDTVTAATVDRMSILGDHRVIVYDPTSYDSKSTLYGIKDFGNGGIHLSTAINKGIRGSASGFWLHWYGRWDRLHNGLAALAAATISGGNGWQLYQNAQGSTLYFNVYGSTNVNITASGVLTAADLAKPQQIQCVYDGTTVYLYFKRVLVGSVACTGYATPNNVAMSFGGRGDNIIPALGVTGFALQGGDGYAPTVAELQACYDATEATGKLQPIPGSTAAGVLRTQHYWDFNQDVKANGPANGMPAQYLDRIGVDHMTAGAAGLAIATHDKPSQGRVQAGIQNFSDVNGYASAAGQGLLGSTTTCHLVWRGQFVRVPGATSILFLCGNKQSGNNAGFYLQVYNGALRCGTSTGVVSSSVAITAAMLFQTFVVHGVFRNGTVQLFVDGVQVGADVASGVIYVNGGVYTCGYYAGTESSAVVATQGATDVLCFQHGGGEYAPMIDEIALQVINAQRDNRLTGLGATKTTHLYDLDKDIAENGGVEAGAPAVSLDRVGTAHLTRTELGVSSALNNIRGVGPFGVNDIFATAINQGTPGNASAWFAACDLRIYRLPSSAQAEFVMGCCTANTAGWLVQAVYVNATTLAFRGCIQSVAFAAQVQLDSSCYGKRVRLLFQRTNANLVETYVQVQGGSLLNAASSITGHNVPTNVPMTFGQFYSVGAGNLACGTLEMAQSSTNQALSGTEVNALFADLNTKQPSFPGKTAFTWDFERAVANSLGRLPSVVPDTTGAAHAQRAGHGLVATTRSERLWSYDDKPILYGAKGDYSNVYSSATAAPGDPSGFMVELFFTILTMNVSAANRYIVGRRGSSDGTNGWTIASSGTHTAWNFFAGNASTQAGSPIVTFTPADVGKLLVFTGVYDGPNQLVRGYTRRARLGTGTALASYGVPTGAFNLGGTANSPSQAIGPFVAIHGFRYGAFVPTANEVLAAYDHMMANEKMLPGGYPGRAFANHYTIPTSTPPATLPDAMGNANLTHGGTPVGSDVYHRMWAA